MHDRLPKMPSADWVRERFGIEDEEELQAVLADPTEMLALLDVVRAAEPDGMQSSKANTIPSDRASTPAPGRRRSTLRSALE